VIKSSKSLVFINKISELLEFTEDPTQAKKLGSHAVLFIGYYCAQHLRGTLSVFFLVGLGCQFLVLN
jgi:hypothetical protein